MMKSLLASVAASLATTMAVLVGSSFATAAETPENKPQIKAKIFDADGKTLLFNYEHFRVDQGPKIDVRNVFKTTDGKEAVTEKVIFENRKLTSYEIDQKQIGAQGKIEIRGDKVHFSWTEDGKTKTDEEKLKDNFVVGPSIVPYLQERWTQIQEGKDLDIRLGVADRRETVGFTLKKVGDATVNGQKAVTVRMKPTSFLISALVKPLHFTFTQDGSKLLEIRGRAIPKRNVDGKFKDLDAYTTYEHAK